MKALFLAKTVIESVGKTKVTLIDVNGGEGLTDFRAGSHNGDLPVDIYGPQEIFTPGKVYLMEISEYNADTQPAAEPVAEATPAADEPKTIEFEGLVQITTVGKEVMVSVKSFEKEETTDTHAGSLVNNDSTAAGTSNVSPVIENTEPLAEANTAGAEISAASGSDNTNSSAPAEPTAQPEADTQAQPGASTGDNKEVTDSANPTMVNPATGVVQP